MTAETQPGTRRAGQAAEQQALEYLLDQGLTLETRNFRCRQGEIDLVMRQGGSLVFIEVRSRRSNRYGGALESVDYHKQQRILTAARYYLAAHPEAARRPCRFDVITLGPCGESHRLQWIRDAFQA